MIVFVILYEQYSDAQFQTVSLAEELLRLQLNNMIEYLCTYLFMIVYALFFLSYVHFCHITIRMFDWGN